MSSIANDKETFFGTNSIEKCSAFYPIQLAGVKFSKESMKELLEIIINKSRALVLILSLPTIKFLLTFIVWIDVLTKFTGTNFFSDKNKTKSSSTINRTTVTTILSTETEEEIVVLENQTIENKINENSVKDEKEILQKDKEDKEKNENENVNVKEEEEEELKELIDENLYLNRLFNSENINNFNENITFEKTENIKLLINNKLNISKLRSSGKLSDKFANKFSLINKKKQKEKNLPMILIVYCTVAFVYIELFALTFALNSRKLPPGLVFLVSSLLFIGYIIKKIFMTETKQQQLLQQIQEKERNKDNKNCNDIKNNQINQHQHQHHHHQLQRQQSEIILLSETNKKNLLNEHHLNDTNDEHSLLLSKTIRISRSNCRERPPFINFQNKTLSKVKIL